MAKSSASPSAEILQAALQGLEAQRNKLDGQIAEVRALMGGRGERGRVGRPPASSAGSGERKKRVLTPEARKRIAAAQKKRWAAFRRNQGQ